MIKLKLGPITEDKPVNITLDLPGALHRNLSAYAEVLAMNLANLSGTPNKFIVPMPERFIATERGFAKASRNRE